MLIGALVVAAAVVWGCDQIARALAASTAAAARTRTLDLFRLFARVSEEAARDPRVIVQWEPLARAARQLWPDELAALDRAAGGFPFGRERIQAAHAQWTADWLAWERAHDAEYKAKAAALEAELQDPGSAAAARARLEAVEREKLERYQRRYEEYVRIAKALQNLAD